MDNKIKIKLGDYNIVAEIYNYDSNHSELTVYLEDKEGCVFQDIALIRPHTEEACDSANEQMIDCLVWGESQNEDYTNKYVISKYDGDY